MAKSYVLLVQGNPSNGPIPEAENGVRPDLKGEIGRLEHILPKASYSTVTASLKNVKDALDRNDPTIVHIAGHCNKAGAFVGYGEKGDDVLIAPSDFARVLSSGRNSNLQLVVVNTCHGLNLAESLRQMGVTLCVTRRGVEKDVHARPFSLRLFEKLVSGSRVSVAVAEAVAVLPPSDRDDKSKPGLVPPSAKDLAFYGWRSWCWRCGRAVIPRRFRQVESRSFLYRLLFAMAGIAVAYVCYLFVAARSVELYPTGILRGAFDRPIRVRESLLGKSASVTWSRRTMESNLPSNASVFLETDGAERWTKVATTRVGTGASYGISVTIDEGEDRWQLSGRKAQLDQPYIVLRDDSGCEVFVGRFQGVGDEQAALWGIRSKCVEGMSGRLSSFWLGPLQSLLESRAPGWSQGEPGPGPWNVPVREVPCRAINNRTGIERCSTALKWEGAEIPDWTAEGLLAREVKLYDPGQEMPEPVRARDGWVTDADFLLYFRGNEPRPDLDPLLYAAKKVSWQPWDTADAKYLVAGFEPTGKTRYRDMSSPRDTPIRGESIGTRLVAETEPGVVVIGLGTTHGLLPPPAKDGGRTTWLFELWAFSVEGYELVGYAHAVSIARNALFAIRECGEDTPSTLHGRELVAILVPSSAIPSPVGVQLQSCDERFGIKTEWVLREYNKVAKLAAPVAR